MISRTSKIGRFVTGAALRKDDGSWSRGRAGGTEFANGHAVQLVSALDRDDLALRIRAQQRQIADEIEHLMPAGLIAKAQRRERTFRAEHDRVFKRSALRQPAPDQRFDLILKAEGAAGRDLLGIG